MDHMHELPKKSIIEEMKAIIVVSQRLITWRISTPNETSYNYTRHPKLHPIGGLHY
jgi:hypothetical protein